MNKTPKFEKVDLISKLRMGHENQKALERRQWRQNEMHEFYERKPSSSFWSCFLLLKQERPVPQYVESGEMSHRCTKENHENMFEERSNKKTRSHKIPQRSKDNITTLLSVLKHLIDQRRFDTDTINVGFYKIKTIVSKHWDGIGQKGWRVDILDLMMSS